MAMIHVNRGSTSLGAFSEEEVREGLRTGRFAPTDIGWREGMANWQPLSQFAELAGATPAAPPLQTGVASISEPAAPRGGLPWDHRQERGFFNAFIETLVMVLTKPGEAFTAMKREGGLGEPLIYALIGGCVGGLVSFLFSLGLQSFGFFADRHNTFAAMAGMGIGSARFVVLIPLFDDCLWRKPIVRNDVPRSGFFLWLHWSFANDPDLRRSDCGRLGARLQL